MYPRGVESNHRPVAPVFAITSIALVGLALTSGWNAYAHSRAIGSVDAAQIERLVESYGATNPQVTDRSSWYEPNTTCRRADTAATAMISVTATVAAVADELFELGEPEDIDLRVCINSGGEATVIPARTDD